MSSSIKDQKKDVITDKKQEYNVKNYCISETIGKGTFGKVKLGVHIPTGEKVSQQITTRWL